MDKFREEHIEKLLRQIGLMLSRGRHYRIEAGKRLRELKELVEHGDWLALLAEIGLKERTAQQYMKEARDDYEVEHKLANCSESGTEAAYDAGEDDADNEQIAVDEMEGGGAGNASDVELSDDESEDEATAGAFSTKLPNQKRPDNVGAIHKHAGPTRQRGGKTTSIRAPGVESIRIGLELDLELAAAITRMRPTANWERVKVDLIEVLRRAVLQYETSSAAMEAAA
jgi:hypothetical protein